LIAALAGGTAATARPAFDPDVPDDTALFLVDDVDQLDDDRQQRLFALINTVRSDESKRLVATGNAPPAQLRLREDVRTRLAWGLVYQLHALSDEEKAQALAAHARSRGFALPADVTAYLLSHMPRDMRTLVAIVDALDAYALAAKRAITVALVREWAQSTA
jgi:DnaA family protein